MGLRYSVLLLAASMALAEEPADLTPEQAEAFAWFDSLGYPDLAGKPFVQVWTGRWYQSGGNPPQNTSVFGFLLSEEGVTFTVFTAGLDQCEFQRSQGEVKAHERVYYLAGDLEKTAQEIVDSAAGRPPEEEGSDFALGRHTGDHVFVFFLARACAANDLVPLARQLYDLAEAALKKSQDPTAAKGLRAAVSASIALAGTWRWTLAFGQPDVSRTKLLEEFRRLAERFPDSEYHGLVSENVKLLDRMVKEDEEHAKTARPLEELSGRERVAELIFQLREQNGQQFSQPGECEIFMDPRGDDSPAALLVKMGYEAVPQLLETIEDGRFTRSVGYWRNFSFDGHHILRVGDCAKDILERISGKSFYERRSTSAYMSTDDKAASVREQAEAWWKDVQSKGEEQVLIETVEKGDRDAAEAADRLLKLAPERAFGPIAKGISAAKDGWARAAMLRVLSGIPGDEATEVLRAEMSKAPFLTARVAAAGGLLARNPDEAVEGMVREWTSGPRLGKDEDNWVTEELVGFLAGCGRAEGIQALASGLEKRSESERMAVIDGVTERGPFRRFQAPAGGPEPDGEARKAIELAIDGLLVSLLDDQEETGMSGMMGGQSFSTRESATSRPSTSRAAGRGRSPSAWTRPRSGATSPSRRSRTTGAPSTERIRRPRNRSRPTSPWRR